MIVVTGSTGRQTPERGGHAMRLLVRDAAHAPRVAKAEIVVGDYADSDSLSRALHEGDRVFMVSLWIGGDVRLELHRSFVDAAARASVTQPPVAAGA